MIRQYKIKMMDNLIGSMNQGDFESFCECEDLPIFNEDEYRFTVFNGLKIYDIF